MDRRKFIRNSFGLAVGLGLGTCLYTWQVEPFWLEFVHHKLPIKNLPRHLIGKTVMQISDVHIGNMVDNQYLIDSFKLAQEMNPDYVVYTGDFVSFEDKTQFSQLKKVMAHAVIGSVGTYGVLGNHDYGHNWSQPYVADKITSQLEASGITILRNQQEEKEGLNIIGFDDCWGTNFKPEAVMNQYDATKANLLLCHNPDVCDRDVWNGYQGWILSGHTHGGQCKPPFLPPPLLPVKNKLYTAGEIDLKDGRMLYINRAIGHLLQVRFNVRPEITVFELT